MFISDPRDALRVVEARGRLLRAEAEAERRRPRSGVRHTVAAGLRRAADRLDPGALSQAYWLQSAGRRGVEMEGQRELAR